MANPRIEELEELATYLNLEKDVLPSLGIEVIDTINDEVVCRCPDVEGLHAHGDATPSFAVNRRNLYFNCYVCGSGSLITLVRHILGLDPKQAIDWLTQHAQWNPMSHDDFVDDIERILAEEPDEDPLPQYPSDMIFKFEFFHPYLVERNIDPDVAALMNIGYDPEHQAIVIPHWFRGKLVGMQRRHLVDIDGKWSCARCSITDKKVPKYKNTKSFPKNTTFYNYDNAMLYESVIVVESPFSVLYMMSGGIPNVIASFGTGLPQKKLELLYRFHGGVTFWPDTDPAGLKSILDATVILEKMVSVFVTPLVPKDKGDPGDVPFEELQSYLDLSTPSVLLPMEGFHLYGD